MNRVNAIARCWRSQCEAAQARLCAALYQKQLRLSRGAAAVLPARCPQDCAATATGRHHSRGLVPTVAGGHSATALAFALCLATSSAHAQLQFLPNDEPQQVFAGEARTISVQFHNPGIVSAEADLRFQLYQASSSTAIPLGEAAWKHLQVLPGQTVLEAATLGFPAVQAETRFLIRWLASSAETASQPAAAGSAPVQTDLPSAGNREPASSRLLLLGTTAVLVYPTNLLAELTSLADGEALGLFDPGDQLKPLLRRCGVRFTNLEETGIADFRGKLAILGPFLAKADVPADLARRVEEMTRKSAAAVWLQPPPGQHDKLQPTFYPVPARPNAVIVAQASLVANLATRPRAQINLLRLCQEALHPEPPCLPGANLQP